MDELSSGSTLGQYELLIRLGRGGMASVWVARERVAGDAKERLLAVKAMLPELASNSDFRAMFLEEGQIVRSIDHPNVVKVHQVGEHGGILYMAMDWVEGDSLRAVIREARRRRPIPPEMAVKIIADAAAGLHAAHELKGWDGELRHLVHCDVSPHNILVGLDGRAKLVDFGVANARLHSDLGGGDKVKGKFAYMSPEQARGERLDRRSDIFSLGIVLFELTTGERLFRGESPAHTLSLVTSGRVPDPRRVLADYPSRLAEITLRALERDPARRFQTADALRDALERYLVEERVLVSHSSVAQLVRRILAPRVEALRQGLREALVARDGRLAEELVPEAPIGPVSSASASAARFSFNSGTPRPQTYETPLPERSSFAPVMAAIGGVAAATASIIWMLNRPGPAPVVMTSSPPPAAPTPARPQRPALAPLDPGVDIASLPMAPPPETADATDPRAPSSRALAPRPARPAPGAPEPAASAEPPAPPTSEEALPVNPYRTDKPPARAEPVHVTLDDEPQQAAPAPAPPPAAPAPAGPAGPFNRGAAMAQLGAAGGRTASCKRPGGPSGAGHVTVTFGPDGSAAKVNVASPFAGTPVGSCVAGVFSGARVPPFTGGSVSLPWSFKVPE
jgi:serine/threonine protein kinase